MIMVLAMTLHTVLTSTFVNISLSRQVNSKKENVVHFLGTSVCHVDGQYFIKYRDTLFLFLKIISFSHLHLANMCWTNLAVYRSRDHHYFIQCCRVNDNILPLSS